MHHRRVRHHVSLSRLELTTPHRVSVRRLLFTNSLSGTIPLELANLTHLQKLAQKLRMKWTAWLSVAIHSANASMACSAVGCAEPARQREELLREVLSR